MITAKAPRHFRVDPRLIHATTMNTWVPATGAKTVLVVDGELEPRRRSILELSAMGEVAVRFSSERSAAEVLATCSPSEPVLVMFSSLDSAVRSIEAGLEMRRLIIGHLPEAPGSSEIHPAVHLGPDDLELIVEIGRRGVEVVVQPLPSDKALPASQLVLDRTPTPAPRVERAQAEMRVVNAKGLHLRAAHVLAQVANSAPAEVHVGTGGGRVNAKSLLGLTTLGATCGTILAVEVEGPEATALLKRIQDLFDSGFDEGADWSPDGGGKS